jgi:hypothetical protein
MDCARCLKAHGPGCPAAVTVDGEAVCVFCLDGLACPVAMRILKQIRSPLHDPRKFAVAHSKEVTAAAAARKKSLSQEDQNVMATVTAPTPTSATPTSATSTAALSSAAAGICKVQGCKNQLGLNNMSGLCRDHRPHTKVNGNGNGASSTARTCDVQGCKSTLGSNNLSGTCPAHRRLQAARAVKAEQPAALVKPNGHDPAHGNGNGNGAEDRLKALGASRIEQRVQLLLGAVPLDAVIEVIPIEDKHKMVSAWLAGTL